jgi:biopolymer transport protein ExbB
MLSKLFLAISLLGAEWVIYLLVCISILSITIMIERAWFYREASRELNKFRKQMKALTQSDQLSEAIRAAQLRAQKQTQGSADLEAEMTFTLLSHSAASPAVLNELAQDAVIRARLNWDRNLSTLATIGSNAPFVGLFGTVLGIIKAFHDLSQQAATGSQAVTAGISEALVATAVGLLVAIPAVVAFNLFQRRVKSAMAEAEAMKSFLIGKLLVKNQTN